MIQENNLTIDLHMHSTVSDGTETPEELLQSILRAGVRFFSLTDHDSLEGCRLIREALDQESLSDLFFINGIEFSCKDELGKYHILGYGYDETKEGIRNAVSKGHEYRMDKTKSRIRFLEEEYGFTFSQEDLSRLYSRANPGKPHIGNMMVDYGYAPDKNTAITEYINKCKSSSSYLRPEEATRAILSSGGIPVLAHPYFGNGSQKIFGEEMENRLDRLVEMGVMGVEAFYSGFSKKMIRDMLAMAGRYNPYITAGSDYHGSNKPDILLGHTGLTTHEHLPTGLKRFLDECPKNKEKK